LKGINEKKNYMERCGSDNNGNWMFHFTLIAFRTLGSSFPIPITLTKQQRQKYINKKREKERKNLVLMDANFGKCLLKSLKIRAEPNMSVFPKAIGKNTMSTYCYFYDFFY